ncbi:MAG: hypothetical protein IAI49_14550 [Candidatus Eremiobacteraeota bacterium]|nr:hypothetical protein [Candidatus Eremiobacteraeota bacterium]
MLRRFDDARAALDEAEALGIRESRARLRLIAARALLASQRGDLDAAAAAASDQMAIARAMKNLPAETLAVLNRADVEHARNDTAHAIELLQTII